MGKVWRKRGVQNTITDHPVKAAILISWFHRKSEWLSKVVFCVLFKGKTTEVFTPFLAFVLLSPAPLLFWNPSWNVNLWLTITSSCSNLIQYFNNSLCRTMWKKVNIAEYPYEDILGEVSEICYIYLPLSSGDWLWRVHSNIIDSTRPWRQSEWASIVNWWHGKIDSPTKFRFV